MTDPYERVIGLEIHVQLRTRTKLLCGCALDGEGPNLRTCPVCLGLPGALPVLNEEAIRLAVRAARALGCRIDGASSMARKSYFYPDLPKGYQITQYDRPIGTGGAVRFPHAGGSRSVALIRLHVEEDAGKSIHSTGRGARSLVDFDRCGAPLLEVVTEPTIGSEGEASDLVGHLVDELVALGITDGRMERGNVRCDANLSLRRAGAPEGGRSEIKNLNSLRNLRRALRAESARLVAAARAGRPAARETRQFDVTTGDTRRMRSKRGAGAYRYFPEPDLPAVHIRPEWLQEPLPRTLLERADALAGEQGPTLDRALAIVRDPAMSSWYAASADAGVAPAMVAEWLLGELTGLINEAGVTTAGVDLAPDEIAALLVAVQGGRLSRRSAREVLRRGLSGERQVREMIAEEGATRIGDSDRILALVQQVIAEHPEAVAAYHGGRTQVIGFLMGRMMERGGRGLDPSAARAILERRLQQ